MKMKPIRLLAVIALALLASTTLFACSTQSSKTDNGNTVVRVVVTRNFGQVPILEETLDVPPGSSAMAALREVADVETTYGGGFVNGINGVRSGYTGKEKIKADWFFYVNGIQSNVGALDYQPHHGDILHFDFHSWSFRHFIPAVIDDFPSVFRYGFGGKVSPTLIVYPENMKESIVKLEEKLVKLGVNDTGIRNYHELTDEEKQSSNLILVGLPDNNLISELNQNWRRLGFFGYFDNGSLIIINNDGETTGQYSTATGIIQATQNPWNPNGIGVCQNVVWLVSGTDEMGVKNALDVLINHNNEFQFAGALVVVDGKILRVPQ